MDEQIDRRAFLKRAGLASLVLATPYILTSCITPDDALEPTGDDALAEQFRELEPVAAAPRVFSLSVASGDPTPTGVMLWTRVDPAAYRADRALAFEVAKDARFTRVVARGQVRARNIRPEGDYTVKLDLNGKLSPNTRYYYRFAYGTVPSRTGRCRTAPAALQSVDKLKFGVITCQDYTNGYYGALEYLARSDVDFLIHMGDFIYETSGDPRFQSLPFPDRAFVLPSGGRVALDLDDYRFIYRTYRSDRFLRHLLEQHTMIAIWDDHETANDCFWDYQDGCVGVPDHPYADAPRDVRNQLAIDARRAWTEYVPARVTLDETAADPRQFLKIQRSFSFGKLIDLFMTDERSYRDAPPCGTGDAGERYATPGCLEQNDPARSMLGASQRGWLTRGLTRSKAQWKVWGNEVFQGPLRLTPTGAATLYVNLDAWDGFLAERQSIMQELKRTGIQNLIVLTGDLHTYIASYLKVDYDRDPLNIDPANLVGTEFMTPAITSANLSELLANGGGPIGEAAQEFGLTDINALEPFIRASNPHIQFFNSSEWGFSTVEFTRSFCEYTAYSVDKAQNRSVPAQVIKRLRVPSGPVQLQERPLTEEEEPVEAFLTGIETIPTV